jgi:hypothetical protein
MKEFEYKCVLVGHHKNVAKVIQEHLKGGWRLHTYTAAQQNPHQINHYLLFERELF